MILKKIKLNNFLSHSDTEISLLDDQKFLLDGKSGAGKSSIVDALIWALYGKGRTENRSLIKRGKKYAKIVLTLVNEEKTEFNITRSITNTGKHDLLVTYKKVAGKRFLPVKASGIKNLQEFIEKQILHSSYLLFLNSIIYPQDNIDSFVKQTAARRKEIILEIVSASDYDEYYEKAKDKVKGLETTIGVNEATITSTENKLKEDRESLPLLSLTELTAELDNIEINTKNKKEKLEIALEKKSEIDSIASRRSDKDKEITGVFDKKQKLIVEIGNLNQKKSSLSVIDIDELKENINGKNNKLKEYRGLTVKINTWNEKMMELIRSAPVNNDYEELEKRSNSQIIDLMKKKIEICPEIGKICPIIVKERDSKVEELSNALDVIIREKNIYLKNKEDYNKQVIDLGEKPEIDNVEFSELETLAKNLEKRLREVEQGTIDLTIEISVKEKELETLKEKEGKLKNEFEVLGLRLNELETNYPEEEYKKLTQEYNDSISRSQELSQTIAVTKNNIARIEKEEKELEIKKKSIKDNQDALKSMRLLKEAFGNNGIKAIVIDYVIPRMEDRINEVLSRLSDFRIRLDTQTKTISGESTKEGLYIDILTPDGEQLSYDNFSGGEKVKISSAIFEGLASFQHCNFRILDESIVSLDNESTRQFIDVVKDIQKNVNQMIVISHIQEVKDCFMDKINIVKKDGISSIEKT
jgi:exonuclease SbcC